MSARFPDIKKLKNKKVYMGLAALIVVMSIVIIVRASTVTPNIATFTLEKGEFIMDIREKGELKAAKSLSVGVPRKVWGRTRITRIIDDGTMVNEGDFLVQFDTSEFQKRVMERQNQLDNSKAELESQQASMESNRKQQENNYLIQGYTHEQKKLQYEQMKYEAPARQREMELDFKKAELSLQQAKEKLESQKIIDNANIKKSELKVKQAEMNLKDAQEQFDSLTLTATKSGMAVLQTIWGPSGREKVKVGSEPWSGMALVNIPDLSVMQVKTKINEVDISHVKEGQQVVITLDALEGPTFYGKVTNVATLATTERGSDVKVFDVEVTIEGTDERLKPGMTAQCKIVTSKIDSVLYVPLESVFDKEDTTVVYVKKGGFEKRIVKVGTKNNDYILIEEGLEGGEEVTLRDPTLPLENLGLEGTGEGEQKSNNKGKSKLPL